MSKMVMSPSFAEGCKVRKRAPDHATTDQCDFLARHGNLSPPLFRGMLQCEIGISLIPLSLAGKGGKSDFRCDLTFRPVWHPTMRMLHFLEPAYRPRALEGMLVLRNNASGGPSASANQTDVAS